MSKLACAVALLAGCGTELAEPGPDAAPDLCSTARGTLANQSLPEGDGIEARAYWLHVPAGYSCESPAPLLVDFHGTAGPPRPEEAYQTPALIAFSEANGVIVVRPRSRSSSISGSEIFRWDQNPGDLPRNEAFANRLVAELASRYAIDPARIYASGFSSGSNMVAQFLDNPDSPFTGLAPIAGGRWTTETLPSLVDGPRIYFATGYRDYLWPYARTTIADVADLGLPADRVFVRRTGGGHDLYPFHFDELFQFLDRGERPGGTGTVAAPWSAETLPSPADVLALAREGTALVAAGARGRVWRHKAAWKLELDRGTADYTTLCFGATGRGFVGGMNTAAHHSGTTWTADAGIPDFGMLFGAGWVNGATCRDDGSIVIGGYWSMSITRDAGKTYTRFDAPTMFGIDAQVAGAAEAPGGSTVLVGYYDFLGTAPRGTTRADPVPHATPAEWWNAVTAVTGGKFWAVGDGGSIAASTDNGATWRAQASGTVENLYAVHFADALHGAAVGRRGTVVVTSDGGAHWTPRPLGTDGFLGAVLVDATTITVAGEDGLVATSVR